MRKERSAFFGTGFKPWRATAGANISGVHSGASPSRTISVSIIFRTRRRSVEDLREGVARFMFCGLTNGNYANVFTTLSMRNGHLVMQQTQGEESAFTIGLAGVFSSESKPAEDLLGIAEVDAVLFQVGASFRLVP